MPLGFSTMLDSRESCEEFVSTMIAKGEAEYGERLKIESKCEPYNIGPDPRAF